MCTCVTTTVCIILCDYRWHRRGSEAARSERAGQLPYGLCVAGHAAHAPLTFSSAESRVVGRKLAWENLADDMQFYETNYPNGFSLIIASDVAYVVKVLWRSHLCCLHSLLRYLCCIQILGSWIAALVSCGSSVTVSLALCLISYGLYVRLSRPE